eukprot:TRINITY_DN2302_c0_g1_i1.p1 TRINITY_DN2302_c0_g1~~TRINITY_DN2302_c0_g1_i1.p1  ORF type:complete len:267 (-),score=91.49 TRINITY_DN2302_c0_g1_i1:134-934(-)
MAEQLSKVFQRNKELGKTTFVSYVTAGFPSPQDTTDILLELQRGGTDIIELGIPFSDPTADGPTIQKASFEALLNNISVEDCFTFLEAARKKGLTVPVVMMGYYNPILQYGEQRFFEKSVEVGVNGFIVVDLPPDEAEDFRELCNNKYGLSYIPLVTPTTSDARLKMIVQTANSFIYCVSVSGVTGGRDSLPDYLAAYVQKIKGETSLPLAVGFGVSTRAQFQEIGKMAEGVVIGSAVIKVVESAAAHGKTPAQAAGEFARSITQG